ncbi:serine protease [bacterium]|nr:serine protease [bacterium]
MQNNVWIKNLMISSPLKAFAASLVVLLSCNSCIPKEYLPQKTSGANAAIQSEKPVSVARNEKGSNILYQIRKHIIQIKIDLAPGKLKKKVSVGSGILWDNDGFAITSFHLFKNAPLEYAFEVVVDGISLNATLVGYNEKKDLALVKIHDLASHPNLRNLSEIKKSNRTFLLGEKVFCIGYPKNDFQIDHTPTITAGVIGAVDRYLLDSHQTVIGPFIQTDAFANTGSSGGGVFLSDGRLVGMISKVIRNNTGSWDGATYAIGIVDLKEIVSKMMPASIRE